MKEEFLIHIQKGWGSKSRPHPGLQHLVSSISHLKTFPDLDFDLGLQPFVSLSRGCSISQALSSRILSMLPIAVFMESRGKFTADKFPSGPTLPPSFDVHSPIAMKIHIHLTQIPVNQILRNQLVPGWICSCCSSLGTTWPPKPFPGSSGVVSLLSRHSGGTRVARTDPASSIPKGEDPKHFPEKTDAASQCCSPAQALAGPFYVVPEAQLGPRALKLGQFRAYPGGISLELGIIWAVVIAYSRTT